MLRILFLAVTVLFAATAKAQGASAQYIVIDVSGGTSANSYPWSTLDATPSSGWTEEHKTTKIVLKRCPKGTDPKNGDYVLTEDFYMGVFEITQRQWELVMGSNPSTRHAAGVGYDRPVYHVSYNMVRGLEEKSFIGILRSKTGLETLDLPTEAQWEYACRAGTKTKYNLGDDWNAMNAAGWCENNTKTERYAHGVGLKRENAWGLYDMHGNVYEFCLGWSGGSLIGNDPPAASSGASRVTRGGSWKTNSNWCKPEDITCLDTADDNYNNIGFRLFGKWDDAGLPELGLDASEGEVAGALADFADGKLKANVKTAREYAALRDWALGLSGDGVNDVRGSSFAYLSYALGQAGLIKSAPQTLDVKAIGRTEDGRYDVAVEVGGIDVGDGAQAENLAKVIGIKGAINLNPEEFSSGNVTADVMGVQGGKIIVRFAPKDAGAQSFFVRAVLQ